MLFQESKQLLLPSSDPIHTAIFGGGIPRTRNSKRKYEQAGWKVTTIAAYPEVKTRTKALSTIERTDTLHFRSFLADHAFSRFHYERERYADPVSAD